MNHLLTNSDFRNIFSFKNLKNSFSDFIAPRHCLVCNSYISYDGRYSKFICDKCFDNIPFADNKQIILNRFHSNFPDGKSAISEAAALMNLKEKAGYIEIIHALKYQKFKSTASEFGILLARRLEVESMLHYDYVVPIPIHTAKRRERGFNQSDLIASKLSDITGMKFHGRMIYRHKYTVTQTLLNKSQRYKNMENVFSIVKGADIQNKTVLLIDDVLTTGSTINSAAAVLKSAGAEKVGAAVLAVAN